MSDLQAEREKAVHLCRLGHSFTEVAAELGRSPQWVGKWWRRYQTSGWSELTEKSRAPHQHGRQLSPAVRQVVRRARSELEAEAARGIGLKYIGGRAIRTRLKKWEIEPLPSLRSIERILEECEMTRPKESPPDLAYPRLQPSQAHQLCQIDHMPHYLQGGQKLYCFNAIDVVSRYPTGQVFTHRRATDACTFLIHVWQTIGLPQYTQVDNEGCFSGGFTHPYVLGQCVRLALLVGTELLFSPVRHPKSNGTVERFHQDYEAHVFEGTYLADVPAVQAQADTFFELYRHSEHHTALNEQTPASVHQQPTGPRLLAADFTLPEGKLPLYAGRLHFMRRVLADGSVSVLNVAWPVPDPDVHQAVWVTLDLSPEAATLAIYNAAPDCSTRSCLATYPFPLKEKVLPQPQSQPAALEPPPASPPPASDETEETFPGSLSFWRWLPVPRPRSRVSQRFIQATLFRTAALIHAIAETMY
jgi:transposase InsO family protein